MCVLVTGGSGVLGLHVASDLAARGFDVVAVSTSGAPPAAHLTLGKAADRVMFAQADIRDAEALRELSRRHEISHVVHCAALTGEAQGRARPQAMFEVNVAGTLHVLELARECRAQRVVYIGSSAEYGPRTDPAPIREDEVRIEGIYAETKYLGHRLANRYREVYGLDVVTARVQSVYGPNTRFNPHRGLVGNTLVAHVSREVAFGRPVSLGADHDYPRAWTHAADAASGIADALLAGTLRHTTYNVASDVVYRLDDLIEAFKEAETSARITREQPQGKASDIAAAAARGPLDVTRARTDFAFAPRFDLASGLRQYIGWWRNLGEAGASQFCG